MADSTLSAIRSKVRKLTRSPSPQQLTDAAIDEYVNTFILYDFPSHLNLFNLRKTFTFFTQPNIDSYGTNTINPNDPMYDFKNAIITTHDPIYVAGYKASFTQSREDFFNKWPLLKIRTQINTGDGTSTSFFGVLNTVPLIPNQTLFTSININGTATGVVSKPVFDPTSGIELIIENLYDTEGPLPTTPPTIIDNTNFVNIVTGAYIATLPTPPAPGVPVYAQTVSYAASKPTAVLFYDGVFTLRPIPDMQYDVKIECYVTPSELLNGTSVPELNQWWQYFAYGAAKKVLEDRTDIETVALIMPEFLKQQQLVLRRTIVQQGDQRSSTIYSDQTSLNGSPNGWWGGSY